MRKKNTIIVTGGAGFVGSNLIDYFLRKTKYRIISIDNYSSGLKKNHIKNSRVNYIKGNTKNIHTLVKKPEKIQSLFQKDVLLMMCLHLCTLLNMKLWREIQN